MPRRTLAFIIVLLIVALLVAATQLSFPILKINKIECQLNNQECPSELTQEIESLKSKSFFFSSLEKEIQLLNINLYQLESISKYWPNQINLDFSHKPNSYFININNQEKTLLVAENGLTQQVDTQQNLPSINIKNWEDPIESQQVTDELHNLNLNLIRFLAEEKISYLEIDIIGQKQIEILLKNNLVAIVQKDNLESQVIKLAIILEDLDLGAIDLQINTIDLRFKFPVLKTLN